MKKFLFEIKKGVNTYAADSQIKRYLNNYALTGNNYSGIDNQHHIYCYIPLSFGNKELKYLTNQTNNYSKELYIAKVYKNGDILYYKPF